MEIKSRLLIRERQNRQQGDSVYWPLGDSGTGPGKVTSTAGRQCILALGRRWNQPRKDNIDNRTTVYNTSPWAIVQPAQERQICIRSRTRMPKSEKTIIRFFMICHTCTQTEHPRIFMILGGFQFLSYVLSGKQYFECFSVFSYLVEHSNLQFLLYVLDGKAFFI